MRNIARSDALRTPPATPASTLSRSDSSVSARLRRHLPNALSGRDIFGNPWDAPQPLNTQPRSPVRAAFGEPKAPAAPSPEALGPPPQFELPTFEDYKQMTHVALSRRCKMTQDIDEVVRHFLERPERVFHVEQLNIACDRFVPQVRDAARREVLSTHLNLFITLAQGATVVPAVPQK